MTHRTAKLAAVYLLLGLAATWAVAWGSALLWWPDRSPSLAAEPAGARGYHAFQIGFCPAGWAAEWMVTARPETNESVFQKPIGNSPYQLRMAVSGQVSRGSRGLPAVLRGIVRDIPGRSLTGTVAGEARGWPLPALRCWVRQDAEQQTVNSVGALSIRSSGAAANEYTRSVLLPYLPHWPGLLADTLCYALLFASLHQLTAWGRRARRRRRGRCAACGYDLTGIDGVCPECGGPRA